MSNWVWNYCTSIPASRVYLSKVATSQHLQSHVNKSHSLLLHRTTFFKTTNTDQKNPISLRPQTASRVAQLRALCSRIDIPICYGNQNTIFCHMGRNQSNIYSLPGVIVLVVRRGVASSSHQILLSWTNVLQLYTSTRTW